MGVAGRIKAGRDAQISAQDYIPFGAHVAPGVISLRGSGDLVATWRLSGLSFETRDEPDILAGKAGLVNLMRGLNGGPFALWTHKIRRQVHERLDGRPDVAFAAGLDAAYAARFDGHRQMRTELYLTLIWRPDAGRLSHPFGRWFGSDQKTLAEIVARESAALDTLEDAARMVERALQPYRPRRLSTENKDGAQVSEMLTLFGYLINGVWEPVPLQGASIHRYLPASRLHFGDHNGRVQIVHPDGQRFAGLLDIQDYPKWTESGMANGLLYSDFEFIETQTFSILNRRDAQGALERQRGHMHAAEDASSSEIHEITDALDELMSGQMELGEYHYSLAVLAQTPDDLSRHLAEARAVLQDQAGLRMAIVDVVPEAAWFAQLPGNWWLRPREAKLTSRNFAGLAPFHNFETGKRFGNPWGEAVALFQTPSGQPYYFNFHVSPDGQDSTGAALPGNTFICGTTGSGKTVLQTALLAFSLKYPKLRAVCFDKDRGMEIAIRALGGGYQALARGEPTGFNPFQLPPSEDNLRFCERLITLLAGEGLSVRQQAELTTAVRTVMSEQVSKGARCLSIICQTLSGVGDDTLPARLGKWLRGGTLGWVFDNDADTLDFERCALNGFDYTDFLDDPEIRTPVMAYLLHRTEALIDGRPFIYVMEEFWKPLMDPHFSEFALNKQKTIRKQNGLGIFVTQSPSDVLTDPIGKTMVEQSVTQIYLPNPRADRADYVGGFKLTDAEFEVVRHLGETSRTFLVKQGQTSAICRFDLSGLDDYLAVLSGTTESVLLLDDIRARHGDDPDQWLPVFFDRNRRRRQNSALSADQDVDPVTTERTTVSASERTSSRQLETQPQARSATSGTTPQTHRQV